MAPEAGEGRLHGAAAEDVPGAEKEQRSFALAAQELAIEAGGSGCDGAARLGGGHLQLLGHRAVQGLGYISICFSAQVLSAAALLRFARETGFEGSSEDWQLEMKEHFGEEKISLELFCQPHGCGMLWPCMWIQVGGQGRHHGG